LSNRRARLEEGDASLEGIMPEVSKEARKMISGMFRAEHFEFVMGSMTEWAEPDDQ
jgi:hypothetical protein